MHEGIFYYAKRNINYTNINRKLQVQIEHWQN